MRFDHVALTVQKWGSTGVCLLAFNSPAQQTEGINAELLKTLVSVERVTGTNATNGKLNAEPIGSAFLVNTPSNHVLLVTAKHVIAGPDGSLKPNLAYRINNRSTNSDLTPESHMKQHAGDWFFSTNADVACRFIVFGDPDMKGFPLTSFLPQRVIRPGAPVLVIGFPLGLRSETYAVPVVRRGIVARADEGGSLLDAFSFPGNSGGPVVYSSSFQQIPITTGGLISGDALLGLISGSITFTDVAVSQQTQKPRVSFEENTGLSYIVPAETILTLLLREDVRKYEQARWP